MFGCEQIKYKLALHLTYSTELPSADDFFDLFVTTGWNRKYRLNRDDLYLALKNSWYCLSVYHHNKLVGFGRILCDGVVHALILDLIVIPEHQGEGMGGELLKRLVKQTAAAI